LETPEKKKVLTGPIVGNHKGGTQKRGRGWHEKAFRRCAFVKMQGRGGPLQMGSLGRKGRYGWGKSPGK